MPMFYAVKLQQPWFDLVKNERKTIEGRANVAPFNTWNEGDKIVFSLVNKDGVPQGEKIMVEITDTLRKYPSFDEFIQSESLEQLLPDVETIEEAKEKYLGLLRARAQQIQENGMIAIPIGNVSQISEEIPLYPHN